MSSHDTAVLPEEAEESTTERAAAARRVARRVVHHERGKAVLLVPVAWLAGLHGAAWIADVFDVGVLIRLGVTVLGAAIVLGQAERRGRDLPYGQVGLAVLWVLAAIVFGPYGWVPIALWAVGVVVSVPFWVAALRRPARPKRPEIEPAEPAAPRLAAQARLWDERVVPNHQAYKATRLEEVAPVPDGYTGIIVGEPGTTRFSQMTLDAAVETIASANQVRASQVAVEDPGDGDASRARVTVIRSDKNLTDTIWLEDSGAAIDPETGVAQIGRYFDQAPAHRQFWTRTGGAQMCVISGDTGSGKSNHVAGTLSLAHRCPLMATALLDPQGGSSQPDWSGKTHVYGEGHEETYENLQMLDFVMTRRADHVAHTPWVDDQGRERSGKPFLLPGDPDMDGMTMLLVCVEELKLFLDGPYGKLGFELLATGVRTWRKAGGGLLVVNQNLGLDNFGNNAQSQSFRSNLLSGGSLTALRTGSSADHHMVGLPADPSKLPERFRNKEKTHGLGYVTGIDCRPAASARMMPVRDAFGIASTPAAGSLGDRTLGFMEEFRHHRSRGRDTRAAAAPKQDTRRTSGDVQATVEAVLTGGPMEVGAVCVAVQRRIGEVPLAEVPAALRTLTRAGVVQQRGDLYQLVTN